MLANWDNVLRAISLASSKISPSLSDYPTYLPRHRQRYSGTLGILDRTNVLLAEKASGLDDTAGPEAADNQLPATLVRIPAEKSEE